MADRKSDHLYTSPKSGDSRKPSPKRKDTVTPPPGDGKSAGNRSGRVGGHAVKKEPEAGEHVTTRGRASPASGRHNSPSPVRGRPTSEERSSPAHLQGGRHHLPNPQLEEGRPGAGQRHEQPEYHNVRQASPYHHDLPPHQQQQRLHMALSNLQQMERKYSPIPFSGYMEPKVVLDRLPGLDRKISASDIRHFSPNPTYHHEQKVSPSSGPTAPVELRLSPGAHRVEHRMSPGPLHEQRPSSLSPLSASMEQRRPSPAHMPDRTSPMPTLGAHITPPPAHVPHQKPHKTSPTVYIGSAESPVEQKPSPNPPTSADAHLPQGSQGSRSNLSPGSHLHGDRSHLSPTTGFGGLGHIERKLSPSRDGRPSPFKAYLLQAVPESERRSPSRHVDTTERKPSPSGERHLSPSPVRAGLSPSQAFRHDLGPSGGLPRFSPNPHHSPSHSRAQDHPQETLRIHVPHHAHGPIVRISPSSQGDVMAQHMAALPVGTVISEDLKGHSPKSLHRPTPALPRAMASPPRGTPVPGKPLLSAHLGGAPFVPQGMGPSGPQPSPAFISQGLIMHAHAPPRASAPLPSHAQPAPNPFSFPGTVLTSPHGDSIGKLQAPLPTSLPPAQTAAVIKPQSQFIRKAVSDITPFKTSPRRMEDSDSEGMPRLTPEGPLPGVLEEKVRPPPSDVGVHQGQDHAEAEYTALPNPFSMRVQILNNFPTNSTLYRSAYRSQSVAMHRARCSCITSAAKSLDILRQNLQKTMNKEIDEIIQKYMEKFFKPGIENIRLNNGQNSVSEEHIHAVSRQILEEAKKMYISERPRSTTPVRDIPDNVSETGSSSGRIRIPSRRRRPSDSDSEISLPVKRKRKGRPPLNMSGRGTPSKTLKSHSPVRREGPKWETDRIKTDTLFVMGARANKALGLGATRGRLYIKHPDIFKYSGDQDDKQWLFDNHHMPATGGKAYMLMVEDIHELAESDEYRDSPNLLLDEIIGFTVPEWMCDKMKLQMAAMRTDVPKAKVAGRSRSGTPDTRTSQVAGQVSRETDTKLPFSAFSNTVSKQVLVEGKTEPSPSNTEEMELLSGDNEEQNHVEMSPLHMTGGFEDVNSDLDTLDEAPFLAQ